MRRRILFLLTVFILVPCEQLLSLELKPVPGWVSEVSWEPAAEIGADHVTGGYYYVLADRQVHAGLKQYFHHYAYRVVSQIGVQNHSELQIPYNPVFETVDFHSVLVRRAGGIRDVSAMVKKRELQREERLESYLLDETKTILLVLSDIRPGDVVEYSYSVTGDNPIFEGRFYHEFSYGWAYELIHFRQRLVKPRGTELFVRSHGAAWDPERRGLNDGEEWIWNRDRIPGNKEPSDAPSWHRSSPWVEVSEYSDWNGVEEWGLRVFGHPDRDDEAVQALAAGFGDPAEILRYVQNEIRYFGLEIGVNSHTPYPPSQVLAQRFGDCKDKTLLTIRLLEAKGISAFPVLVSVDRGRELPARLPTPRAFDHAIVYGVRDGKEFWFDPTNSLQGGTFGEIAVPEFGSVLVLDGRHRGLVELRGRAGGRTEVAESYRLKPPGETSGLEVTTTFRGSDADRSRYYFASRSREEIQNGYRDFYEEYYPQTESKAALSLEDDLSSNVLVVSERYAIGDVWQKDGDSGLKAAFFTPYLVGDKIRDLGQKDEQRVAPLALEYPLDLAHRIHMELPEPWPIQPESRVVENASFRFAYSVEYRDRSLDLVYEFRTKKDHVPPSETRSFSDDLEKIRSDYLGYRLSSDFAKDRATYGGPASQPSTLSLRSIFFLIAVLLLETLALLGVISSGFAKPEAHEVPFPRRIGGWLVIFLTGLGLTVVLSVFDLTRESYWVEALWDFGQPGGAAFWQTVSILIEFLFGITTGVMASGLIYLARRRDRRFPVFVPWFFGFAFLVDLFGFVRALTFADPLTDNGALSALAATCVSAGVWIPYFLLSKRVKETFVD